MTQIALESDFKQLVILTIVSCHRCPRIGTPSSHFLGNVRLLATGDFVWRAWWDFETPAFVFAYPAVPPWVPPCPVGEKPPTVSNSYYKILVHRTPRTQIPPRNVRDLSLCTEVRDGDRAYRVDARLRAREKSRAIEAQRGRRLT